MKAILISIKPKWCELIASGKKAVEVRKTRPKIDTPFKCYIYCTKGYGDNTFNIPISKQRLLDDYIQTDSMHSLNCPVGNCKVIGEFICDKISINFVGYKKDTPGYWGLTNESCLSNDQLMTYGKWKTLYGWHISNIVIYDKPKELNEFYKKCDGGCGNTCKHCNFIRVNADEFDMDCDCDGKFYISKPPQSWCYVEEQED